MELLYFLLILLIAARCCGEVAERLGQPSLVGELIAGVGLGIIIAHYSTELPFLDDMPHLPDDPVFGAVTDIGIFFLMLMAGIELSPRDLARSSGGAFLVAIGGMVLPLALGFGLAWLFVPESDYKPAQALFLGIALAVTALPATVKALMDLGKLNSRVGQMIVSAAIIDDVLSLILLAVLTGLIRSGEVPSFESLGTLAGTVTLFFAISIVAGIYLFPHAWQLVQYGRESELAFSVLLIAALGYAVLAEILGLHFIVGAFFAGLFFGRRTVNEQIYKDVRQKISGITGGFLAPVFFASIGLHISFSAIIETPAFLLLLILAAFFGKLVGAGVMASTSGFGRRESLAVGFGMGGRGAVELIIANVALQAGLFSLPETPSAIVTNLFSSVVIMAVVTTVATPIALRLCLSKDHQSLAVDTAPDK